MTPRRSNSFIKKAKDISVSGALAVALLGSSVVFQSCGSGSSDTVTEEVYTKGVKTYIAETEGGKFKIMDEEEVSVDSSMAIVTYMDGRKDTLSPALVKSLIDDEVRNSPHAVGQNNGLSNVLLYGAMGYLLARTMSPNYGNIRQQPPASGVYNSPNTAQKSAGIQQNIGNSRTSVTRPVGASSGHFKASGRNSGGAA